MIPGPPEMFDRSPATALNPGTPTARLASRIVGGIQMAADWLEARPGLVLIIFSVLYWAGTGSYSRVAVLSHDEVWTLLVTKLPGWSGIWEGLAGGADFHPPLHYMLAQSGMKLLGGSLFGYRLASVFAFWLFSICIFCYVKYRSGTVFAAVAMLIPFAAATLHFPHQARGYSLMLGFNALSMVCWQRAETTRWRPFSLLGLGVSIFLGIASHYYGVLMVACLAIAEIARGRERKRFDKLVWLAMGAGLSSLIVLWPFIQSARQLAPNFWARPGLKGFLTIYEYLFSEAVSPVVYAFLGIILLDIIIRNSGIAYRPPRGKTAPLPEYILVLAVSFMPFIAFVLAKTVTNAFDFHYVLPTIAGLAICFAFQVSERTAHREMAGLVVLSCFFGWFVIQQRFLFLQGRELTAQPLRVFRSDVNFDAIDPERKLPIVAPDRWEYLQFAYYWPPGYAERLYFLASDDGPPDHLESLQRWSDLHVPRFSKFVAAHKRFLVYGTGGQWGEWVLWRLADEGAMIEMKGSWANHPIFVVTMGGR